MDDESLKSIIQDILREEGKLLSAIQIHRNLFRSNRFKLRKSITWIDISRTIRGDIQERKKESLFYEEIQGIYGLKEWELQTVAI